MLEAKHQLMMYFYVHKVIFSYVYLPWFENLQNITNGDGLLSVMPEDFSGFFFFFISTVFSLNLVFEGKEGNLKKAGNLANSPFIWFTLWVVDINHQFVFLWLGSF